MASNITQSEVDYTCPVCCDIFTEPVVLMCGHSFCKVCIQEWWRQSTSRTCPVCKELFLVAQPPPNLALRNLSDTKRQERSRRAMSVCEDLCSLHSEKLKLFCQDDEQLICVICRDAQQHKKHNCIPINEAAEDHKTKLKVELMHLKNKLGSFETNKLTCDKMAKHIKIQAQQTENTIKEEFQKLYQYLRAEESAKINEVRKEATLKSEAMSIRIVNLNAVISSLRDKIKTIEREIKAEDFSFMKKIKSIIEQCHCKLPDPETPSGALINEAKHVKNMLFTVWNKMNNIIQYSPVTLDPNTGDSSLTLSAHFTCSTVNPKAQKLPGNPERKYGGILGHEGFSSGKHSWDVEVDHHWALGVTAGTSKICGIVMHTEEIGPLLELHNSKVLSIPTDELPKKVRVQLDYDGGLLSFFDLQRKKHVHTIKYSFTQTVFPYFNATVKILPAEVSVRIKQPR